MGYSIENHIKNMLSTLKKTDIRDINSGLMKYGFKLSTKLEELKYSDLTRVYAEALDSGAERYASAMRQGHGVGCCCNYCCM